MQLVLFMEFSQNIMKIVVYPQIIFINLAKKEMIFNIKEGEVTYHDIKLSGIQPEYHRQLQKNKSKLKQWEQQQKYLNQIINLENQKLQQREVLKSLFQRYDEHIQIFTGQLNSKKKMVYKSGKEYIKKEGGNSLKKSMIDFVSDFAASDTEQAEMRKKKRSSNLSQEEVLKYGSQQHLIFKRYIPIENSFNLVFFTPTVHIINKSQAIFYAKSRSENLVMIPKESHNFILTNEERIDIQACFDELEEVSLTEWTQIDLQQLKTIYYAKDMIQHHGSGYDSKEYNFRKKKMKKMPKIFYRVITCKYQRGTKILIEQSQYPPISFINNTNDRIKIQEHKQRFLEQLVNKGDMAQYAPRNPYQPPQFRLQIAQHYEYRLLTTFKVQKKQTLNLDFGIVLSIQQYKDNMIINIKPNIQQEANDPEKKFMKQILQQKDEFLLEQKSKNTFSLKQMTLSIMNNWNKEINATFVENVNIDHENKNNKDYYKLSIGTIEGYDYMGVQPQFIFHSKKDKKIFHIPTNKDKEKEKEKNNYIEFQAIIKEHKNALVIQKCQGTLRDSIFCISADLILAYVKNYYQSISNFYAFSKYQRSKRQEKKRPQFYLKKFIVQSLKLQPTSLTFKTRNLSILQTFLNRNYEKLIVKFLNWLGDLEPLFFDTLQLNHVQTSLKSILNQIDLRKKMHDFGTLLMEYPLNEMKELAVLIFGDENLTVSDKLNSLYKIFKTAEYIVAWALSLNQNLKTKTKSYSENFIEINKQNNDIFDKMKKFEYCEWRYIIRYPRYKLQRKIRRLERFNTRDQIQRYDQNKAKIKLAIDSFLRSKLFRNIQTIYVLNKDTIMSIVEEWIIIYQKTHQWTIIRVEYFLNCELNGHELTLSYWQGENEIQSSGIFQNKGDRVRSKVVADIDLSEFNRTTVAKFKQQIRDNILSYYY